MSPILTTTLLALLTILPLASAKDEKFKIGYTVETGHKITFKDGDDVCSNEFQTLVEGPGSEYAAPCNMAFFASDDIEVKMRFAYTDCGSAPPQVWEVDGNGGKIKQVGTCVDDKGKEECWWGNLWDSTDGNDVVEWPCQVTI